MSKKAIYFTVAIVLFLIGIWGGSYFYWLFSTTWATAPIIATAALFIVISIVFVMKAVELYGEEAEKERIQAVEGWKEEARRKNEAREVQQG
jgi:hypothetical protein